MRKGYLLRALKPSEKEKQKNVLKIEEELLYLKFCKLNNNFDMNAAQNVSDIDKYISKGETLINAYFELSSQLKICVGDV